MKKLGKIFIVISIILYIVGIGFKIEESMFYKNAESTTAIVDEVKTTFKTKTSRSNGVKKSSTTTKHKVYISYAVEGKEYNHILFKQASQYISEGDEVTVYYKPSNPEDIRRKGAMNTGFSGCFLYGTIALIMGVGFSLVGNQMGEGVQENLKVDGICYNAEIISFKESKKYYIDDKHSYHIECQAMDPSTGKMLYFWSPYIRPNLSLYNITTVPVYVSKTNSERYYIDAEAAVEEYLKNQPLLY